MPRQKLLGVPCYELLGGKIRDRIRVYWSHCATWRINHPDWYKPPITDLDGVKAIGREVREKKFTALKTNIFTYDAGKPTGWRPGFGVPFAPEINVDRKVLRDLRTHLEAIRDGAGPDIDILLDLNFNAKTEGYLKILRAIARSRHVLDRDRQLQPRSTRLSGVKVRIRSPHARRFWVCASFCPISANRLWMSRSSIRHGTASGSR